MRQSIRTILLPAAERLVGARRGAMMLLATILLTLTAQTAWANGGFSGSGTEGDPFLITSTSDLDELAGIVNADNNCEDTFFKLTDDITYDKTQANNYTPIGDIDHPFKGTFDGQGHSISGIRISDTNSSTCEYKAIFGSVMGTVKNLVVSDCSIVAYQRIGGITAIVDEGTIENCHVGSNVTLTGHMHVGGIAAQNLGGTIKGCTSAAAIIGTESAGYNALYLGGIAGYTKTNSMGGDISPTLTDNLFTGTISGDLYSYIGAIVGLNDCATPIFTNNFYTTAGLGGVGADGSTTGADVAGTSTRRVYEEDDEPSGIGTVVKTYGTGSYEGLTVYTYGMSYSGKYYFNVAIWAGSGTAESPYIITTTLELDYLAAQVNGGSDVRYSYFELGGNITYDKTKENNFTPIGINTSSFSGTFDGKGYSISGININKPDELYKAVFGTAGGTIKNLTVKNSCIICFRFAGGIVVNLGNGRVENCYVDADVTLSGNNYVGGIVGDCSIGTIIGCTSAATITGTKGVGLNASYLGGIAGSIMNGSTLTDNLFLGTINGQLKDYIGAITGDNSGDANSFDNNVYTCDNYKGVGTAGSTESNDVAGGTRKAKNIATCTASVPNQALGGYTKAFYKFEAANSPSNGITIGESVKDGETLLTLGTDYKFGSVSYQDPNRTPEYRFNFENDQPGDECLVEIIGMGAYAGTRYASFTIIPSDANGNCGTDGHEDEVTWRYDSSTMTLTISGTGPMKDDYHPWSNNKNFITKVVIGDGVTAIGENAFKDHTALSNVTIGSGVMTIGENAFECCTALTALTIPYGVTEIKNLAFQYCSGLTNIIIPASVTYIGFDSFYNCIGITDVYCYVTDPSALTWTDGDCDDFKFDKANTTCHVFDKAAFDARWATGNEDDDVCVTFVGDLATIPFNLTELEGVSHLAALAGMTLPVQFSRTFDTNTSGTGKASTVCLPFEFDKPDEATVGTFYTFGGVTNTSGEYVVTMNEVTAATLSVGTPYLFQPKAGSELTFGNASFTVPTSITAGMTEQSGWQFTGTFTKKTWASGQTRLYGFAAADFTTGSGQIASSDVGSFRSYNSGYCDAFRCYLWAPDPSSARGLNRASGGLPSTLKVVLVSADGETTGIGMLDTRTGEVTFGDEWYSLDGTKLSGEPAKKGVYIHKGKKVKK